MFERFINILERYKTAYIDFYDTKDGTVFVFGAKLKNQLKDELSVYFNAKFGTRSMIQAPEIKKDLVLIPGMYFE